MVGNRQLAMVAQVRASAQRVVHQRHVPVHLHTRIPQTAQTAGRRLPATHGIEQQTHAHTGSGAAFEKRCKALAHCIVAEYEGADVQFHLGRFDQGCECIPRRPAILMKADVPVGRGWRQTHALQRGNRAVLQAVVGRLQRRHDPPRGTRKLALPQHEIQRQANVRQQRNDQHPRERC